VILSELRKSTTVTLDDGSGSASPGEGDLDVIVIGMVAALFFGALVVWAVTLSIVYDNLSRRIEEQRRAIAELRSRLPQGERGKVISIVKS
jgi:hypothetical protein